MVILIVLSTLIMTMIAIMKKIVSNDHVKDYNYDIESDVAWHNDNCPTFAVSVMIMKTHVTYLCAAYISLQDFSALRNEKCIS